MKEKGTDMKLVAQTDKEQKQADRLINATITRNWVMTNMQTRTADTIADANRKQAFTKVSPLSQKRAAAQSPVRAGIQFRKYLDDNKELFDRGVLKTPHPVAEQIWNGDEKGFDANGTFVATYNNGRKSQRGFRVQTGEHSPFRVTMFYWSNASGKLPIAPTIIHESSDKKNIRSDLLLDIPEDWMVSTSESAMMDKATWKEIAFQFVRETNASVENPQFIYIDGYDAHFDADALTYLLENHCYVRFLRAQASTEDQPNDIGPNEALEASYSRSFEDWRRSHPGVPFNKSFFNNVIADAWNCLTADEKTERTVTSAFSKANLYPMIDIMSTFESDENVPDRVKKCARLAEMAITDIKEKEVLQSLTKQGMRRQDNNVVRFENVTTSTIINMELATPQTDNEVYKLAISTAAHNYFQRSFVTPAQELRKVLEEQQSAKRKKVPRRAGESLTNPDTTTGAIVTKNMLVEVRQIHTTKKLQADEKERKKEKKSQERIEKIRHASTTVLPFFKALISTDPDSWKKLTISVLKSVHMLHIGPINRILSGESAPKKAAIVASIEDNIDRLKQLSTSDYAQNAEECNAGNNENDDEENEREKSDENSDNESESRGAMGDQSKECDSDSDDY